MIRTSLIYFIADACIDRLFDPIYVALMVDPVQPLRKLDRLAWIDFFDGSSWWRMEKAIVCEIYPKRNVVYLQRHRTGAMYVRKSSEWILFSVPSVKLNHLMGVLDTASWERAVGGWE